MDAVPDAQYASKSIHAAFREIPAVDYRLLQSDPQQFYDRLKCAYFVSKTLK